MFQRSRAIFFAVFFLSAATALFAQPVGEPRVLAALPNDGSRDTAALPDAIVYQQAEAIGDLDGETTRIAGLINQRLSGLGSGSDGRPFKVKVESFLFGGGETFLGIFWKLNLSGGLSNIQARNFILLNSGADTPDYELSGEIVDLVSSIRIYTRLVQIRDGDVLGTWYSDLEKTEFLRELLANAGASGSGQAGRDRYEPDSRERPLAVEIGGDWISRSIHAGDDTDWFVISPDRDSPVTLETSGGMDTVMELYEGNSTRRLRENDDGGEETNARIDFSAEAGKRYIAMVKSYEGETGEYRFQALYFEAPDASMEPNDTREQAHPITPGEDVEAFFSSSSDLDWYRLEIPSEGGRFTVQTEGNYDTMLTLYDSGGNELAEDDDSGNDSNARITRVLPAGTVFIKARLYGGDSSSGLYTLRTRIRADTAQDSFEPDDRFSQAKDITAGRPQTRTFSDGDDVDWVRLQIRGPGQYAIRARGESSANLDTYIELFDADRELLEEDDDGGEGYDSYLSVRLENGTYYVKVHTLEDDPEDRYTLSVEAE
jgi:hypothetical protein